MKDLTSSQKSIWVTEQYYKGSSVNNISGFALIEEQIDFEKLEKAIQIVIQKHDNFCLRLKIYDGEIKQVLSERKKVEIDTMVFATKNELREVAEKIAKTPFNIEKSELFKFYIFKLKNGQGGFMPSVHHLISDAWTIALISNEVIKIYSELKKNQEVETEAIYSYIDYIESEQQYLQSEKYQKDRTYWEEKFVQIPEVATIPGSKENIDESNPLGNRLKFEIQSSKIEKIKKYCKENKVSLYNFFMAIYGIYIGEITNLDEFVIGTPILNRTNFKEKNAMGMFINMAPFKINMSQNIDFKTFVKNIASDSMGMLKHQKYSYQHLLENLRNKNKNIPNLYNIFLSYQVTNAHQSGEDMNYTIEWVYNGCCAEHIDIQIFDINDTGDLSISYDYKTSIYEEIDIQNLHYRILNIINQVIEKENINIRDIEIVTPAERRKIVEDFNKTELKYEKNETVISLFEKQAEKTPSKVAIISNGQKLNEKANMLARDMIQKGVKQKDVIGIMLNRSPEMIIGLVAILKCGATYLPIDPEYPAERITYMLKNSETKLVLVNNNTEKFVPSNCGKINIKDIENKNKENLNLKINGDSLVYLIYTSGSTGKPKGVQITNKNLNNFIKGMKKEIDFNPNKTMVSVTTICFDIFGLEMWCSLTSGQTLVVANESEQTMPVLLNKLCLENNVNMIQTTPSRYSVLFEDTQNLKFLKNITEILVGGEAVNDKILANMKKYSKAKIYNVYGPTETTIWSTMKELTNEEKITVGKPIANTQCYILNKNHKLLPINMPGELYIGGDGVSNGYLKRDDLNEEKFIKPPFIKNSKIYNTNDLAYFTEEGEIVHLGRTDYQVKIRGFRIELGEIENAIEKNEKVNQAVVVKRKLKNGHYALIAYYTIMEDVEVSNELKQSLNKELPQYMVPQYFVKIEKMPHTPNGKIDRKALPEPEGQEKNKTMVGPRNEIDKGIIEILSRYLKQNEISLSDSFYELGGDSLTAISLCTSIQSKYGVQISIKDIFNCETVQEISDLITNNIENKNGYKIKHIKKQDYYKLLPGQVRMYYSSAVSNESSVLYNIPGAVVIDGLLDSKLLEQCFKKIIYRHESLRTYFEIQGKQVVQKIKEEVDFKLNILNDIDFNNFESILKEFIKPFNLHEASLFRAQYVEFSNNKSAIFFDIHHIIADGKSISILINEICELYNKNENLPDLQYTYKDFSSLLDDKSYHNKYLEAEKYWLNQFEGEIPVLNMPTKNMRPVVQAFEGARVYQTIDNSTYNKIRNISRELNITPYMLLLGTYYILLEKYTGQQDIIIGTPCSGRDVKESQDIIGMFVNTLPLRNHVNNEYTVSEFLENIKTNVIEGFKNQIYPFNEIVDKLNIKRDSSRNLLFDTMFIYQSGGYEKLAINNFNATYHIPDIGISKFDLSIEAVPLDDNIKLSFEYCTKLFNKDFIINLSENYINVLNSIINNINIKISDIEILSKKEKQKILYEFNDTNKVYPEKTFSTLFEEQVERTPNKVAIVFEDKQLTYKELNEKSNSLAYYLRNIQKVSKENAVGIMINRSLEMIIAILGVMKAGGTYIPIDPSFPEDRIQYMLESSSASILLTSKRVENKIDYKNKISIDLSNNEIYSLPNQNLKNINKLTDLLYIIFTSGSTGKPKGVMQTQKTFVNFVHYCNDYVGYLKEPEDQTIVSISTMSFDIFSYEALMPLQRGVKVVIANVNEQITPKLLNDLMVKNNVTATQATPSVMQIFANNVDSIPYLKKLKYLTLTGEQVPITLVRKLKSFGDMIIYDGYGPTETYYCTLTEIKNDFITIGRPFYNDQMYILDKYLKPVPIGVIGEIYIAGDGLAKGYLNNPELTAKSFIKNPFKENSLMYKSGDLGKYLENGEIICLGRSDNQIKIRGLRIELEEIESLISKYPNIEKVAVLKQCANNREFISAYYVAKKRISINELRKYLAKSLPRYMIPSYYVPLDEFIYTPNGKIDRKSLPLPKELFNMGNEEYVAPKTELQKKLIKIFENVLNTSPIGINDNFFELGGDSLLAMKLNIELLEITNKISYSDIFKFSTVCEIEEKINSEDESYKHNKIEEISESSLKILDKTTKQDTIKEYHPKNVLLTGATGYLGVHILEEFIKNEESKVYCIVRKEPGLSINRKLTQKLNYYFGDKYNDLINKRIIAVNGDISQPNFGLQGENLIKLTNDIDAVINSAANVAHFGVYEKFYNANVKSVKYIVDFCKEFNKKLYQISTTGVSGKKMNPNYKGKKHEGGYDESCLYIGQYIDNVYTYTKFEAETIVLEAIAQGVDAYILRLGNLMPRLRDGLFQENIKENAFITKIKDIMELGIIPEYLLDMPLEFTPVDTAAHVVYKLITNKSDINRIFHVYNHNIITLDEYIEIIKEFGYNLKVVKEDIFKENIDLILKDENKKIKLQNIVSDLDNNYHLNYNGDINLNSDFTIKYLKKCEFNWPRISKEYVINFIKLMREEI